MNKLKISTRVTFIIGMMALLLVAIGAIGLLGISKSNDALEAVHDEGMLPALMAAESVEKLVQNRVQVLLAFQHAPDSIPTPHAGQAFSKKQGAMPATLANHHAICPNLR